MGGGVKMNKDQENYIREEYEANLKRGEAHLYDDDGVIIRPLTFDEYCEQREEYFDDLYEECGGE